MAYQSEAYLAWKEKKKDTATNAEHSTQAQPDSGTTRPSGSYQEWKAKQQASKSTGSPLGEEFASRFRKLYEDSDALSERYRSRYSSGTDIYRGDSADWLRLIAESRDLLGAEADDLQKYLDANRRTLDKTQYRELTEALRQSKGMYADMLLQAQNEADYYSQWDSEESYNEDRKRRKDYEAMVGLDLDTAQKEIEGLERQRDALAKKNASAASSYLSGGAPADSTPYAAAKSAPELDKSLPELNAEISRKKQYLNLARLAQEGAELAGVADPESEHYDSNYDRLSRYSGTQKENPEWWENGTGDTQYEWINNQNGFRDQYEAEMEMLTRNGGGTWESPYLQRHYDQLTDAEIGLYNYYYAKEGPEKAQEYLDHLEETLNYRDAQKRFAGMEGKTGLELGFAAEAGLESFETNLKSLLDQREYIPQTGTQIVSGMVRQDLEDAGGRLPQWLGGGSAGQLGYDLINTSANMAPSILVSMGLSMLNPALGSAAGTTLMGASAAGGAYQEKLNQGYEKGQARTYAALIGGSEAALQYALGGIGKLGGKISGNVIAKALDGVDNAFLRFAGKWAGSIASEGLEEGLQEVLTPLFENLVLYADEEINWNDVGYSALLGALSAGVLETGNIAAGEFQTGRTGRQLENAKVTAKQLSNIGRTFSSDSVAYQLSERVSQRIKEGKKTGAYTMGRLMNEIGASLTAQNKAEITNALIRNHVPEEAASASVEILSRVAEGTVYSDAMNQAMEEDNLLAMAVLNAIGGEDARWNLRNRQLQSVQNALRQGKAAYTQNDAPQANKAEAVQQEPAATVLENRTVSKPETAPASGQQVTGKLTAEDSTEVQTEQTIEQAARAYGAQAGAMLHTYHQGQDVAKYDQAYRAAFDMGRSGVSLNYVKNSPMTAYLTDGQKELAHKAGAAAARMEAQSRDEANKTGKSGSTERRKGTVKGEGVTIEDLRKGFNDQQGRAYRYLASVAEATGVDIVLYKSKVSEADGKYQGEQGRFVWDENKIYIDVNAGLSYARDAGEAAKYAMLRTFGHEFTHFIEKWNPVQYNDFRETVFKTLEERGENVNDLIEEKMALDESGKMTYEEASREVVAEAMTDILPDSNFVQELAHRNQTVFQKLLEKLKEFTDNLRNYFRSLGSNRSREANALKEQVGDTVKYLDSIVKLFDEAAVGAVENYQESLTPGEEGTVVNREGEPVAHATTDGTVQLSVRTYEESGRKVFRDYLEKCVKSKKLTKTEMQEMLDGIEDIYEVCREFKDKYAPFSAWSDAAVVRDTYGKPVFSVVTPNGDYKMNLDFSLVCKKRRTMDAVFNEMARRGIIDDFELGQKSVVKINEIIRKHGLETSCALCFVDAKRFRQASMADAFTSLYNELVESLVPENQRGSIDHFNFSGYETIKKVEGGIDTWDNSKLDFSHLDHVMKTYGDGTVEHKAARYIKSHPEGRKLLLRGDFMSSKGFDAVKTQNQDILKLYNSKKGTGGPKAAFGDVQYMNEVIQKARWWTPKKAYEVGGIRIQSFSDYVPRMVFDYVQMIYDLAATKLPAHAYSKEALFVKQFGLTGVKINMSLIPAISEGGVAPGLDANGNYVWAGESFDFETAKQIQNAPGYTENCGTICVGVSDRHIRKLLSDPDIRMVIPYHKSGLNPIVAHMNKIAEFTDYTNKQNTTVKETGSKAEKHFDFNAALHKIGKNADPRAVIQQYFDWCDDNGYEPKFAEFRDHPNYYKLIEDFTLFDKDGNYVPQREVRAVFPKETDAFGSMKDLIQEGLQEDAVVEGKRDKNLSAIVDEIERTIPKTEAEIAEEQVSQADRDLEAAETDGQQGRTQYQQRTDTMTDREVLKAASAKLREGNLSKAEQDALDIFDRRMSRLEALQQERENQDRLYQEQKSGENPNSTEAAKTRNRVKELDRQIRNAGNDVLEVENKTILRKLLQKGKQIVEQQERARSQRVLENYRKNRAALRQQKSDTAVMEREFIRIAKAYEKLDAKSTAKSGKDAQKIEDLKAKLKEEAQKHRDDQNTWDAEFKRLLREYEAADRSIDRLKAKIERQEQSAKDKVEKREKTAMRHKIQNVVKELNDLLLNESKKRHIPDNMKKAVAQALDLVNMDTLGAEERIARYRELIAKETDQDKIDAYTATMENIMRQGEKLGQRLRELRDAYEEIENSTDPDIANFYDPVIAGSLRELSQSIGNTALKDMSIEQLSDVYDMYRMVLTRVRDANKAFLRGKSESIAELATKSIDEVKLYGGEHKSRIAMLDPVKKFFWNNMKPVYAMEWIGSKTLTDVFNSVRAGEDTWAKDVTEARTYYLEKSRKFGYDKWDFNKKYRFESTSGITFDLTLEQILSLYAYSRRDQAIDHLRLGGFVFDSNIETYKESGKGKKLLKYKVNTADAHQLSAEILSDIIGTLTAEQRGFVEEMQDYLSTTMGAKGNEVTMKMYGVKLFKEKHYFPLKSAKQFLFEQNEASGEVKLKNSGFTNKTVAKANNPVILQNFMDVWSGHVNDMSMYHSFVLPLEDFNRVLNYNSPKKEGVESVSVKGTIQSAYGPAAVSYLKQMITDLNGGARSDPTAGIINKFTGLFKKGAVFASMSVVVQQPSAIARAAALVDTQYFFGPKVDSKKHKQLWDEIKRYAPVAIIKEMGYFDTNMGQSTQDYIQGKEYSGIGEKAKALFTDSNYRDEALSKLPALADEMAWCNIWEAVKRETKSKNPDMKATGEEFLKKVGERFTEVIVKTQVYDSVLSRSAFMRSKDTGMKAATAFMAEPTTSINMIADALVKGKRGDRLYARTAIGAVLASQILNSILVSFVYAARDDDDDQTYAEKYVEALVGELRDSFNPAGYIPFIKDIQSIAKGYTVERSDMAVISDLWEAWQSLGSDKLSGYKKVEKFAGSIAQMFGLPLKNIMRDIRAVWQVIEGAFDEEKTTSAGLLYAIRQGWTGETVSNQKQLYDAMIRDDREQTERVSGRYKDESAVSSAIRKGLREYDSRIWEAAKLWNEGDLEGYMKIAKEIVGEKHFTQDDVVLAIRAEAAAMEEKKTSSNSDRVYGYFTAEKFGVAVSQGNDEMAKIIRQDLIDTAMKNGKSERDAESSFNTSARSAMKELWLEGKLTDEAAVKAMADYCGDTREEAEQKVAEWSFARDNGFGYDEKAQQFKDGKITGEELKDMLMETGGKSAEEAAAAIVSYSRDAYEEGYFSREDTAEMMTKYGGLTEAEAEDKLRYIDYKMDNPGTYADDSWIDQYYAEIEGTGISIDLYVSYRDQSKGMKKADKLAVIDSLPISDAQKDALYYAEGWAESKLWQAPWRK